MMHIVIDIYCKIAEKKDKFKHGLGGLQGLRYDTLLVHYSYNGNGRFADNIIGFIKQSLNKRKTN